MDLSLEAPLPQRPEGEAPRKVRMVENHDEGTQRLLVLLTKLALSSALQVRALRAILLDAFRVPSEMPLAVECQERTRKYAARM